MKSPMPKKPSKLKGLGAPTKIKADKDPLNKGSGPKKKNFAKALMKSFSY